MNSDILKEEKTAPQAQTMRRYYRWQSVIYDLTRWTFLFGRNDILKRLPIRKDLKTMRLVEVGCGTGRNLKRLAGRYPDLLLTGLDVSNDMLRRAAKATSMYSRRILLLEKPYEQFLSRPEQAPDFILFSYALTMFNPGWENAIRQAHTDLADGGHVAVVDFHDTFSGTFRWWMGKNHVRMDRQLLPLLESTFEVEYCSVRTAFFGLWQYVLFIGKK